MKGANGGGATGANDDGAIGANGGGTIEGAEKEIKTDLGKGKCIDDCLNEIPEEIGDKPPEFPKSDGKFTNYVDKYKNVYLGSM